MGHVLWIVLYKHPLYTRSKTVFNIEICFQVVDGAFMALMPKQTSQSIVNLSLTSDKSGTTKPWDYQRLGEYENILAVIMYSGSHRLEKYLNIQDCLEN